ncbi:MAG TPA: hypothetical protein DIT04_13200 [Dysgonomonas sp.]|nr:hypothetical protein [Dysgonomonas sp.]
MKNLFLLLFFCLFSFPTFAVNDTPNETEAIQSSAPSWINSLFFTNRQSGTDWASGEMYFPETATVTFFLAAPSSGSKAFKYYLGYKLYYVNADMGDQYIIINIPKGTTFQVRIEKNGVTEGTPARITTTEVNGYSWRPYPIVK